jgi:phenylalanine-4-hydroxylase
VVYKITKPHIQISTQLNNDIRARLRGQACTQIGTKTEQKIWDSLLDRTYDLIKGLRCHM